MLRGCRHPATHTTAGHRCGRCSLYGHGVIECGDRGAIGRLRERLPRAPRVGGRAVRRAGVHAPLDAHDGSASLPDVRRAVRRVRVCQCGDRRRRRRRRRPYGGLRRHVPPAAGARSAAWCPPTTRRGPCTRGGSAAWCMDVRPCVVLRRVPPRDRVRRVRRAAGRGLTGVRAGRASASAFPSGAEAARPTPFFLQAKKCHAPTLGCSRRRAWPRGRPRASRPCAWRPRASRLRASQPRASRPRASRLRATRPRASRPRASRPRVGAAAPSLVRTGRAGRGRRGRPRSRACGGRRRPTPALADAPSSDRQGHGRRRRPALLRATRWCRGGSCAPGGGAWSTGCRTCPPDATFVALGTWTHPRSREFDLAPANAAYKPLRPGGVRWA